MYLQLKRRMTRRNLNATAETATAAEKRKVENYPEPRRKGARWYSEIERG